MEITFNLENNIMKMNKIISTFFITICLFFVNRTNAQDNYKKGFRLGFGLNGGVPLNEVYSWSLGADARLQYDLSKRTSLALTTGFTNFFINDGVKDLGFIPAKLGIKAFVWNDEFYILGEAGAGFPVTNGYNKTTVIWSPGIGYASKYIDASIRFENYDNFETNQISLRLAYGFQFKFKKIRF
jgi:hypothetical protein